MSNPEPPDPIENLIIGLVPYVGQQVADFQRDRYVLALHRQRLVAEAAAEATGWTPEELLEAVAADEHLGDMLLRALEAARRSGVEEKLRALGRAVATGALATDDADVDTAELLIRTLDDLEAPEIRRLVSYTGGVAIVSTHTRTRWRHQMFDDPADVGIDASLERQGLIRRSASQTKERHPSGDVQIRETISVTTYGQALMRLLLDDFDPIAGPTVESAEQDGRSR